MASIVRSTTNRAVHLRIFPRPSNLGESREILRLISQFGEVEYFKNLKYDHLSAPNAALVIYKDEDAAQHCLRKSPIRFRMGKAIAGEPGSQQVVETPKASTTNTPSENPFSASNQATANEPTTQDTDPAPKATSPSPPVLTESLLYQIQIHPARVHFRDQINSGHYHGPFSIDSKSVAQGDLAKSVPLVGLSCVDWRAGDKPWRILQQEQFQEHESWGKRKSLRELYNEAPKEGSAREPWERPI